MSVTGDFKLFVGNMPGDVSPEEIRIAFSKFGPIVEVYIMGGNRSRSGQSSAFVKFTTPDACNLAIQEMHMKGKIRHSDSDFLAVKFAKATPVSSPRSVIQPSPFSSSSDLSSGTQSVGTTMFLAPMGSIIGISPSEYLGSMTDSGGSTTAASSPYITPLPSPRPPLRTCKLFVGGLPIFVDRDDLIAIFCPFGKVESVHLMNNNKSKSGQNCAFINYYSRDCAKKAIDSLSARYQTDDSIAPLTVRFADSNPTETADADGNSRKKQRLNNSGAVLFPDLAKQLAQQAALSILSSENVSEP